MSIIVVVGMPGSGKEEFVRVAMQRGYSVVRMGDVVRKWAAEQGVDPSDSAIGSVASGEREEHGMDIWARRTIQLVEGDTVIDGTRGDAEIAAFREEYGEKMVLVAIDAEPGVRFERLRARGRGDAPEDMERFKIRDAREMGWGIGRALELADARIDNNSSLEDFRERARAFLDGIPDKV